MEALDGTDALNETNGPALGQPAKGYAAWEAGGGPDTYDVNDRHIASPSCNAAAVTLRLLCPLRSLEFDIAERGK